MLSLVQLESHDHSWPVSDQQNVIHWLVRSRSRAQLWCWEGGTCSFWTPSPGGEEGGDPQRNLKRRAGSWRGRNSRWPLCSGRWERERPCFKSTLLKYDYTIKCTDFKFDEFWQMYTYTHVTTSEIKIQKIYLMLLDRQSIPPSGNLLSI